MASPRPHSRRGTHLELLVFVVLASIAVLLLMIAMKQGILSTFSEAVSQSLQ